MDLDMLRALIAAAPAKLGVCVGEGQVLRAGESIVFAEGRLWGCDGKLAVHATATMAAK